MPSAGRFNISTLLPQTGYVTSFNCGGHFGYYLKKAGPDELGMDTISTANTLFYAMEANEKGLWDNGLRFSETERISRLFEDVAYRRGNGDELAQGSRRLFCQ